MEIGDVLKKPFRDIKKLVIGSVLGAVPIVNFVLMGYGLEIASKPKEELPDFNMDQFTLGLKAAVVGLVYMLIPGFAAVAGVYGQVFELTSLAALLALAVAPLTTMAVVEMSKTGEISDGLKFQALAERTYTNEFLGPWLIAALLSFAASLVLSIVPVLGWILSNFVTTVVFWTYLGSRAPL